MVAREPKKEIIAMLLAGGQGSRLGVLTDNVAKPAISFGGKYRIIDFPLSNCSNSDIDTIGVLTQYQPLELNAYIGNGQAWDLDRMYGGVSILPPYIKGKSGEWYKGTANAIYQNMNFIELYDPEYVIILSGDHVYKMNYRQMLEYHKEKNADCTIAVISVPISEASRFGVMNTDENFKIYEFEEKPSQPKSNLASMGVYIFTWDKLKKYLEEDELNSESSNDFGKNIIPTMLEAGENMYAYEFKGYWKDVGTVESLWEANMDIINPNVSIQLDDPPWKIYSRERILSPQYIGDDAVLKNAYISEGCNIDGEINNSIIFPNVSISEGVKVINSVIMSDVIIKQNVKIANAIISSQVIIEEDAIIGEEANGEKEDLKVTVVGSKCNISIGRKIPAGVMVSHKI